MTWPILNIRHVRTADACARYRRNDRPISPKEAKTANENANAAKTVPEGKTKTKTIQAQKMLANTAKKIHLKPPKKMLEPSG